MAPAGWIIVLVNRADGNNGSKMFAMKPTKGLSIAFLTHEKLRNFANKYGHFNGIFSKTRYFSICLVSVGYGALTRISCTVIAYFDTAIALRSPNKSLFFSLLAFAALDDTCKFKT
jgi:ABC-type spermidine/putrescine transport system permease subunit I